MTKTNENIVATEMLKERVLSLTDEQLAELSSVNEWKNFSLHADMHTEDEIRFRSIVDVTNAKKASTICYTFVCGSRNLTEDLIEELMFITSGLFDWEYYDTKHIKMVLEIIASYNPRKKNIEEQREKIKQFLPDMNPLLAEKLIAKMSFQNFMNPVTDRLDWFMIGRNTKYISREFRKKYHNQFSQIPNSSNTNKSYSNMDFLNQ